MAEALRGMLWLQSWFCRDFRTQAGSKGPASVACEGMAVGALKGGEPHSP